MERKQNMYQGRKYYSYKPQKYDGNVVIDTYQNNKVVEIKKRQQVFVFTNYFKMLVDQKIDYLLTIDPSYDEIDDIFDIQDILGKLSLLASLDKCSWLHLYINSEGRLDWTIVEDVEIIPLYDKYNKYITEIIRYKEYKENNTYLIDVEVWDKEKVSYIKFSLKDNNLQLLEKIEEGPHYITVKTIEEKEFTENVSFGFIPFIPLWNNKSHQSDLNIIQELLDMYNQISSGFIDNIFRFQEFLLLLRGFGGQDLEVIIEQLKKFKAMNASDKESGAEYLKVEIPVEARKVILEIIKKNIFLLGRGVDPDSLEGSQLTNVVIKSKYANLDMKGNDTEKQYKIFYKELIYDINIFYRNTYSDEIIFTRNQIFNTDEKIKNCIDSLGVISLRTILENHPFVVDVEEELRRIKKENEEKQRQLLTDLGEINESENESGDDNG